MLQNQTTRENLNPQLPGGIKRVQVGCGPKNILEDWWNVDIRPFNGIDQVMDATQPWKMNELDYVYGEHFLEHLDLEGAVAFLENTIKSLKVGGILRFTTPSLEWVLSSHFDLAKKDETKVVSQTFGINRAFHGWGHKFLYSQEVIVYILEHLGYENIEFCNYGKSDSQALKNLERHGGYTKSNNYPSVWIVEASKTDSSIAKQNSSRSELVEFLDESFCKYVRGGH